MDNISITLNNFLYSTKNLITSIINYAINLILFLISQWQTILILLLLYFSSTLVLKYGPTIISTSEYILRCEIYPNSNETILPLLKTFTDVYDKLICWRNSFTLTVKLLSAKFILKQLSNCSFKVVEEAGALKLISDINEIINQFISEITKWIFKNPFVYTFPLYSLVNTTSLMLDGAYDTLNCLCEILNPFWKFVYYSIKNEYLFCFLHLVINGILSFFQNILITIYNLVITILTSFFSGSSIEQVFVYIWGLQVDFYNTWVNVLENIRIAIIYLGSYIYDVLETFVCILVSEVQFGTQSSIAVDNGYIQCKNSGDAFPVDFPCLFGSIGTFITKTVQVILLLILDFGKVLQSSILGGDFLWKEVNFDIIFDSIRIPLNLNASNLIYRNYWIEKSSISTLDLNYEYNLYNYFLVSPYLIISNPPQLFDYITTSNSSLNSCSSSQKLFDSTTFIKNSVIIVVSGGISIESYNYPIKLFSNASICSDCQKRDTYLNFNLSSIEGCICNRISINADNLIERAIGVRFVKLILCDIIFQVIRIIISTVKFVINIIQKFTFAAPYKIIEPLAHRLSYDRVLNEIVGPPESLGGLLLIPDSILAHFTLPLGRGILTERTACIFRLFTYTIKGIAEFIRVFIFYTIQSFFADIISLYTIFPVTPAGGYLANHFCLSGPSCIRINESILKWFRQPRNEDLYYKEFVPFFPINAYDLNIPIDYDSYFYKGTYNIYPNYNGGALECFCAIFNLEFLNDFTNFLSPDFTTFLNNLPDVCCSLKGFGRIVFGLIEFILGFILAVVQTFTDFFLLPGPISRIYILDHLACLRNSSSSSIDSNDYQCSNINALANELTDLLNCGCITIGDLLSIEEIQNNLSATDPLICLCTLLKSIVGIISNVIVGIKDFARTILLVISCITSPTCLEFLPLLIADIFDAISYIIHLIGESLKSSTCVFSSFFDYDCLNDPISNTGPACTSITFETCVIFKKECYGYFPSTDINIRIPTNEEVDECVSQCNDITGGTCIFCRDLIENTNYDGNNYIGCPYGCYNPICKPTDKLPAFIKSFYDVIGNLLRLILSFISDFAVYAAQTSSGGSPPPVTFPTTITGYIQLILDTLGESLLGDGTGRIWGILQYFGDMLNCLIGPPGCIPVVVNDPPVELPSGKVFCFGNVFILTGNILAKLYDALLNFLISFLDIVESLLSGNFTGFGDKIKAFILALFGLLEVFFNSLENVGQLLIGFVAGLIDLIFGGGYDVVYSILNSILQVFVTVFQGLVAVINFIENLFDLKKRFTTSQESYYNYFFTEIDIQEETQYKDFLSFLYNERKTSSFANSLSELLEKFMSKNDLSSSSKKNIRNFILKKRNILQNNDNGNFNEIFIKTYNLTEEEFTIIQQPHLLLSLVSNETYCYKVLYKLQNITSFQDMSLYDELAFKSCYTLVILPILNNANSDNVKFPLDLTYNTDRIMNFSKEWIKLNQLSKSYYSMFHQMSQLWINNNVNFGSSDNSINQKRQNNFGGGSGAIKLENDDNYIFNIPKEYQQNIFDNSYVLDTSSYTKYSDIIKEGGNLKGYYDEKDGMTYKNFTYLDVFYKMAVKQEKSRNNEFLIKNFIKYGTSVANSFQNKNLDSYTKMSLSPYLKTSYTNYFNFTEIFNITNSINTLKKRNIREEKESINLILDKKSLEKLKYLIFYLRRLNPGVIKTHLTQTPTNDANSFQNSNDNYDEKIKTTNLNEIFIKEKLKIKEKLYKYKYGYTGIEVERRKEPMTSTSLITDTKTIKRNDIDEESPNKNLVKHNIDFEIIKNNFNKYKNRLGDSEIINNEDDNKNRIKSVKIDNNLIYYQFYSIFKNTIPYTFDYYSNFLKTSTKNKHGSYDQNKKRSTLYNNQTVFNRLTLLKLFERYYNRSLLIYNTTGNCFGFLKEKYIEKLNLPFNSIATNIKRVLIKNYENESQNSTTTRNRLTLPERMLKITESFNLLIEKKSYLFSNISDWKFSSNSSLMNLVKESFLTNNIDNDQQLSIERLVEFSCPDCNCSILETFIQEFLDITTFCYEKQFLNNNNPENLTIIYKTPTIKIISINDTSSNDFITNAINNYLGFDLLTTIEYFFENRNIDPSVDYVGFIYFIRSYFPLPYIGLPCQRINLTCQMGLGLEKAIPLTLLILFILLVILAIISPPLSNIFNSIVVVSLYSGFILFGIFLLASLAWGYQYNCYYVSSGSTSLITYLVPFLNPASMYPECAAREIFAFIENYIVNPCPFSNGGLFEKLGINIEPLFVTPQNLDGYCFRNNITGLLESQFSCDKKIETISCYDYGLTSIFPIFGLFLLKYTPGIAQGLLDSCLTRGSCFNFLIGSTTYPGTNNGVLSFLFSGINVTAFQQNLDPILNTCLNLNLISLFTVIPILAVALALFLFTIYLTIDIVVWFYVLIKLIFESLNSESEISTITGSKNKNY